MTDLTALIDVLKKAECGSRELDAQIAEKLGAAYCAGGLWPFADGSALDKAVPHYTTSLDAALTLVPEAWTVAIIGQTDNKHWYVKLHLGSATSYGKVIYVGDKDRMRLKHPALALCIASLRARSKEDTNDG